MKASKTRTGTLFISQWIHVEIQSFLAYKIAVLSKRFTKSLTYARESISIFWMIQNANSALFVSKSG